MPADDTDKEKAVGGYDFSIAKDLPKTVKLYYDERMFAFGAKVLKVSGEEVVLDQTAFYPRGGGQEPDHGTIAGCMVYDAEKQDDVIIHKVKSPSFKEGDTVSCIIEKERREQIMKHHTAAHIITMAARQLLGDSVWQAGSEKDADKAHIDLTYREPLNETQVKSIEDLSNEIVSRKIPVMKEVLPRRVAEQKYGVVIYQGGYVPEANLRIISIAGIEPEACGGLHVDNTAEIEEIFIISGKRVRDGVTRLEFVAGKELVEKTKQELENREATDEEIKNRKINAYNEEKARKKAIKESAKTQHMFGVNYIDSNDIKQLVIIARESIKENPERFVILVGNGIVVGVKGEKCSVDIETSVKKAASAMGGSASGKDGEFKGGGPLKEKGKETTDLIKQILSQTD